MPELRTVLIGAATTAALIIAAISVLPASTQVILLTALITVLFIADCLATVYIWRIWRSAVRLLGTPTWLLAYLSTAGVFVCFGLLPIVAVALLPFIGVKISGENVARAIGLGVLLIGTVPLMKAILFFLIRRRSEGTNGNAAPKRD